jgi:hypothetical protein
MTAHFSNRDFRCIRCGTYILAMHSLSGVNHRNHCPWCLWSRHMDLYAAGDRLSACKAPMRPLGMAIKPGHNKYAPGGGELMLVHQCEECGRLSLNRIAADDDVQAMLEVFSASCTLPAGVRLLLLSDGIRLLEAGSAGLVTRQLLGEKATALPV